MLFQFIYFDNDIFLYYIQGIKYIIMIYGIFEKFIRKEK